MPAWLVALFLKIGKPAFILLLRLLESKFPGIKDLIEAIIEFLQNNPNKTAFDIHKHCDGLFCPTGLKG